MKSYYFRLIKVSCVILILFSSSQLPKYNIFSQAQDESRYNITDVVENNDKLKSNQYPLTKSTHKLPTQILKFQDNHTYRAFLTNTDDQIRFTDDKLYIVETISSNNYTEIQIPGVSNVESVIEGYKQSDDFYFDLGYNIASTKQRMDSIAILDSGYNFSNDINPDNIIYTKNFVDDTDSVIDYDGHGTTMTSVISGNYQKHNNFISTVNISSIPNSNNSIIIESVDINNPIIIKTDTSSIPTRYQLINRNGQLITDETLEEENEFYLSPGKYLFSPYSSNDHTLNLEVTYPTNQIITSGSSPGANLVIIKVMNQDGQTNSSILLRTFSWLLDNYLALNISIINLSFTLFNASAILDSYLKLLSNQNIIPVSPVASSFPGSSNYVIPTRAIDLINDVSDFHNSSISFLFPKGSLMFDISQKFVLQDNSVRLQYDSSYVTAMVSGLLYNLLPEINPPAFNTMTNYLRSVLKISISSYRIKTTEFSLIHGDTLKSIFTPSLYHNKLDFASTSHLLSKYITINLEGNYRFAIFTNNTIKFSLYYYQEKTKDFDIVNYLKVSYSNRTMHVYDGYLLSGKYIIKITPELFFPTACTFDATQLSSEYDYTLLFDPYFTISTNSVFNSNQINIPFISVTNNVTLFANNTEFTYLHSNTTITLPDGIYNIWLGEYIDGMLYTSDAIDIIVDTQAPIISSYNIPDEMSNITIIEINTIDQSINQVVLWLNNSLYKIYHSNSNFTEQIEFDPNYTIPGNYNLMIELIDTAGNKAIISKLVLLTHINYLIPNSDTIIEKGQDNYNLIWEDFLPNNSPTLLMINSTSISLFDGLIYTMNSSYFTKEVTYNISISVYYNNSYYNSSHLLIIKDTLSPDTSYKIPPLDITGNITITVNIEDRSSINSKIFINGLIIDQIGYHNNTSIHNFEYTLIKQGLLSLESVFSLIIRVEDRNSNKNIIQIIRTWDDFTDPVLLNSTSSLRVENIDRAITITFVEDYPKYMTLHRNNSLYKFLALSSLSGEISLKIIPTMFDPGFTSLEFNIYDIGNNQLRFELEIFIPEYIDTLQINNSTRNFYTYMVLLFSVLVLIFVFRRIYS